MKKVVLMFCLFLSFSNVQARSIINRYIIQSVEVSYGKGIVILKLGLFNIGKQQNPDNKIRPKDELVISNEKAKELTHGHLSAKEMVDKIRSAILSKVTTVEMNAITDSVGDVDSVLYELDSFKESTKISQY